MPVAIPHTQTIGDQLVNKRLSTLKIQGRHEQGEPQKACFTTTYKQMNEIPHSK